MLIEKIDGILEEIKGFNPVDLRELEDFRINFLGKKGKITALFQEFKNVPPDQKKEFGQKINELKNLAQEKIDSNKEALELEKLRSSSSDIDLTLDGVPFPLGSQHPLTLIRLRMENIFMKLGFTVTNGPEIVDDWHNFTALNIPENHPAKDMQDTFFVKEDQSMVLRTHTSSVQVSTMQKRKPPIKTIAPGRTYRKDNDSTHSPFFSQVEGLYVDKNVSFADLKQTLYFFVREMFGEETKVRFRPSYFPFTEPSAEMDISWVKDGKDSWMEVLGCGMVDPNVLTNCGIDPEEYTGFAFGIGIERIAMLKFGITDIRTFFENDTRFLKQFSGINL